MKRVALVGAGAVGAVCGTYLQKAGMEVGFVVRPGREGHFNQARHMHQRRGLFGRRQIRSFTPSFVVSTADELAAQGCDEMWLCVPATALDSANVQDLVRAWGPRPLLTTTPGLTDVERLTEWRGGAPVVQMVTGYLAWIGPLDAADAKTTMSHDDVGYWFPPLSPSMVTGPEAWLKSHVPLLARTGFPVAVRPHAAWTAALASAAMMPTLQALERESWSWAALRKSARLRQARDAAVEAIQVVAADRGRRPPRWPKRIPVWSLRMALRFAPLLAPLDLERFIEVHFTKVGEQTRAMMRDYVSRAEQSRLPSANLAALRME